MFKFFVISAFFCFSVIVGLTLAADLLVADFNSVPNSFYYANFIMWGGFFGSMFGIIATIVPEEVTINA